MSPLAIKKMPFFKKNHVMLLGYISKHGISLETYHRVRKLQEYGNSVLKLLFKEIIAVLCETTILTIYKIIFVELQNSQVNNVSELTKLRYE